jgi:CheY-like chemotaxis protein
MEIKGMSAVNYSQTTTLADAVLVIDDNAALRSALADFLGTFLDLPVYTATNGLEGLQVYRQQQQSIALVLLDLEMPVMNGVQTYLALQQIAPQVKVVISSALSSGEAGRHFSKGQMPTFLAKPYDLDNLLNVVQAELRSEGWANSHSNGPVSVTGSSVIGEIK